MRGLLVLAVLSILIAGCTGGKVVEGSGEAPDWSFTDIDGVRHSRDSSKGGPVLLFFMATWCSKCMANAPKLVDVHHAYASEGLRMYTLSHDPSEDAEDLRGWKAKYGQMWPHGVDAGGSIAKTFQITTQSSIVVLDAEGREVRKWIYAVPSMDELRAAIETADA